MPVLDTGVVTVHVLVAYVVGRDGLLVVALVGLNTRQDRLQKQSSVYLTENLSLLEFQSFQVTVETDKFWFNTLFILQKHTNHKDSNLYC